MVVLPLGAARSRGCCRFVWYLQLLKSSGMKVRFGCKGGFAEEI